MSPENYRHVYTTRCDVLVKNGNNFVMFLCSDRHEALGSGGLNVRTTIGPANHKSNVHALLSVCNTDNGLNVQNKGDESFEEVMPL